MCDSYSRRVSLSVHRSGKKRYRPGRFQGVVTDAGTKNDGGIVFPPIYTNSPVSPNVSKRAYTILNIVVRRVSSSYFLIGFHSAVTTTVIPLLL